MHSFARHAHRKADVSSTQKTKGLILEHLEKEEMRPPRFSAFPGAGFVWAHKS